MKKRFVRAKFDDDLDLMDDEKLLSFDLESKKKDKIKRRTSNEVRKLFENIFHFTNKFRALWTRKVRIFWRKCGGKTRNG